MHDTPLITTVITTFQRPHLLKKAIQSVLSQTYRHIQICVYDNASDDETEEIVRKLMKEDPRVFYHRHPTNIGMMANYKFAISKIATPLYSLLSDDDTLLPWFYETALEELKKFPDAAFCACGVEVSDESNNCFFPISTWKKGFFAPTDGLPEMIINPLYPTAILFQRDLVKDIAIDFSRKMQIRWDTDFLLQIISKHPFVVNKTICANFQISNNGYSSNLHREMTRCARSFSMYIHATEKMRKKMLSRLSSHSLIKQKANELFKTEIKKTIIKHLHKYVKNKQIGNIFWVITIYIKLIGIDEFILKGIIHPHSRELIKQKCLTWLRSFFGYKFKNNTETAKEPGSQLQTNRSKVKKQNTKTEPMINEIELG